uniref:C2H2-type domain-containing protein n=1 Tax=Timema bartmani TaxID=61472 RepID=A0A7R9EU10_9NEOP|nr:unnamed protein product [Timema bartmani]
MTKHDLQLHFSLHKEMSGNKCKVCGECFTLKREHLKHDLKHNKRLRNKCEVCDKGFTCRGYLKKHYCFNPFWGHGIPHLPLLQLLVKINIYYHANFLFLCLSFIIFFSHVSICVSSHSLQISFFSLLDDQQFALGDMTRSDCKEMDPPSVGAKEFTISNHSADGSSAPTHYILQAFNKEMSRT